MVAKNQKIPVHLGSSRWMKNNEIKKLGFLQKSGVVIGQTMMPSGQTPKVRIKGNGSR
jgi:type IV secretory pathway TraG/TraD family ATPase VirD4